MRLALAVVVFYLDSEGHRVRVLLAKINVVHRVFCNIVVVG